MTLHKGDRFKIFKIVGEEWLGWEQLSRKNTPENDFSPANDNFGGQNIYVNRSGEYLICIQNDHIQITKKNISDNNDGSCCR